jgi:hypothetical protein
MNILLDANVHQMDCIIGEEAQKYFLWLPKPQYIF